MKKEIHYGGIQLWKTTIVDLKEQAKHARTLKAKVRLARALNDARGWLKYAESKILILVVIVNLGVIATILSGCNTVNGIGKDLQSVSKPYIVQGE